MAPDPLTVPAVLARLAPLPRVHPVRIASHSQIRSLVAFALAHLRDPDPAPLLLHCLAPSPPSAPSLDSSAAALPKLVSVAELVKREFLRLDPSPSSSLPAHLATSTPADGVSLELHAAAPPPSTPTLAPQGGLHQYTRLTSFEALGLAAPPVPGDGDGAGDGAHTAEEIELMRQDLVALEWLSGRAGKKRRPRRKHTPCMVVVLSVSPLDALPSSFTHQPPAPIKPTKGRKRPASVDTEPAAEAGLAAGGDGTEGKKKRRRRRHKGGKKDDGEVEGDRVGGMDVDEGAVQS
ncbi:hypothetical protein JCM3770_005756 [Rhodotorula araucariae]